MQYKICGMQLKQYLKKDVDHWILCIRKRRSQIHGLGFYFKKVEKDDQINSKANIREEIWQEQKITDTENRK